MSASVLPDISQTPICFGAHNRQVPGQQNETKLMGRIARHLADMARESACSCHDSMSYSVHSCPFTQTKPHTPKVCPINFSKFGKEPG